MRTKQVPLLHLNVAHGRVRENTEFTYFIEITIPCADSVASQWNPACLNVIVIMIRRLHGQNYKVGYILFRNSTQKFAFLTVFTLFW